MLNLRSHCSGGTILQGGLLGNSCELDWNWSRDGSWGLVDNMVNSMRDGKRDGVRDSKRDGVMDGVLTNKCCRSWRRGESERSGGNRNKVESRGMMNMVQIPSIPFMRTTNNFSSLSTLPKSLSAGDYLATIPSNSHNVAEVTSVVVEGFVGCNSTDKGKGGDYKLKSQN